MQRIAYGAGVRLVLGGLLVGGAGCGQKHRQEESDLNVIYGDDNRQEVYQSQNVQMKALARSTAALVKKDAIQTNAATGMAALASDSFGSSQGLCSTERFFSQPNPAFCSGFLVAPDILVTAGHCITSQSSCLDTAFVFGMGYFNATDNPTSIPPSDVYYCSELIHSQASEDGADFAVLKLNRAVNGRAPLAFRRSGKAAVGDPLTVIGYPSGLPTKITDGAHVRDNSNDSFLVADTDTYGGNSGSSVFHATTGLIEGILVRGEQDFSFTGSCYVSKVCTQHECRGEDITLASAFAQYVPDEGGGGDGDTEPVDSPAAEVHIYEQSGLQLAIPDNNRVGVQQKVQVPDEGVITGIKLELKINHTYIGDLVVSLVHPNGPEVVLHNRAGGSTDNINATYEQVLAPLKGKQASGSWALKIADRAAADKGKLSYLKLSLTTTR